MKFAAHIILIRDRGSEIFTGEWLWGYLGFFPCQIWTPSGCPPKMLIYWNFKVHIYPWFFKYLFKHFSILKMHMLLVLMLAKNGCPPHVLAKSVVDHLRRTCKLDLVEGSHETTRFWKKGSLWDTCHVHVLFFYNFVICSAYFLVCSYIIIHCNILVGFNWSTLSTKWKRPKKDRCSQ